MDTVFLCFQLVKHLEHGRCQDPNPAVFRGLEASEGPSCPGELPKNRAWSWFPEARKRPHVSSHVPGA